LLIDDAWSCVGSTNWDPRSLRLNFEFNLVCHDAAFASRLHSIFEEKKTQSLEITEAILADTTLAERLRNGIARLFIPVL
jgi:cardiolipin synthase